MPLDLLPTVLLLLTAVMLALSVAWGISRPVDKRGRAVLVGSLFSVIPTLTLYVWVYHRADLAYSYATSQGDTNASYCLGFAHMKYGEGAVYDPDEGRRLLEEAAAAGHPMAAMTLGCYLLSGVGVPNDEDAALALFDRAAPSIPDAAAIASEVRMHGFDADYPKGLAESITIKWMWKRQ